jgi:hypothetical protein
LSRGDCGETGGPSNLLKPERWSFEKIQRRKKGGFEKIYQFEKNSKF